MLTETQGTFRTQYENNLNQMLTPTLNYQSCKLITLMSMQKNIFENVTGGIDIVLENIFQNISVN